MHKKIKAVLETGKPFPLLSFPSVALLNTTVGALVQDAELQAEGMRRVAERTDAAASVSFMDLSVEAECFGAKIEYADTEVPTVLGRLVTSAEEVENLQVPQVGSARSGLYIDAVKRAKTVVTDRPVFAGTIGPFSLAARLAGVTEIMMDCYDDPDTVCALLEKTTAFLIEYAKAYKAVGADGIVMAEPVAGMLSPSLQEEFSAPFVKKIVDAVQDEAFAIVYHNCGDNVLRMLDSIAGTGAAAYHFGNAIDLKTALAQMPETVCVMGNIDPAKILCNGTTDAVREATEKLLNECGGYENFILSSGCDIPPATPWENIDAFFESAKK